MPDSNLKNKSIFYTAPAVFICWCLFCITGCKDPLVQNTNLLRQSDSLNVVRDTLAIKVTTEYQSHIASSGVLVTPLGSLSDHNFGTT
ncbi:MAG TPA: hypothetical protein VG603_05635, partial [Chitinophagales bacterium]|nr:hypothetical protein [Chitinophagales bacterium]